MSYIQNNVKGASGCFTAYMVEYGDCYSDCSLVTAIGHARDRRFVEDVTVHFNGTQEELFNGEPSRELFHVAWYSSFDKEPDEIIAKHFYLTEDDAVRAAVNAGLDEENAARHLDKINLRDSAAYGYAPVQFPFKVVLHQNDRGLYFHTNLHPEIEGKYPRNQKVFFPDRSCTGLCAGPALVKSITLDKGTYAFVDVEMVQYEAPSEEQIIAFCIANGLEHANVKYMTGPFGQYAEIVPGAHDRIYSCLVVGKNEDTKEDIAVEIDSQYVCYVAVSSCTGKVEVADLICQQYHGRSFDDLYRSFARLEYEVNPAYVDDHFFSALMDAAVGKGGFLNQCCASNVRFFRVNEFALKHAMSHYTPEQMAEIAEVVNKVNADADIRFKNLLRRGNAMFVNGVLRTCY